MSESEDKKNDVPAQPGWSIRQHHPWKMWLIFDLIILAAWIAMVFFPHRAIGAVPGAGIAGWIAQRKRDAKMTTTKFEWQMSDWIGAAIFVVVGVAIVKGVDPAVILHWLKSLL